MNQGLANSYESGNERVHSIQQSFLTASIAGQRIGIPIAEVQDVLNKQKIHKIPLSPPAIVGALNLRGRIVTALDLRLCLNLEPCAVPESAMSIVVEDENELYSLLVDEIGDVEHRQAIFTNDRQQRSDLPGGLYVQAFTAWTKRCY